MEDDEWVVVVVARQRNMMICRAKKRTASDREWVVSGGQIIIENRIGFVFDRFVIL